MKKKINNYIKKEYSRSNSYILRMERDCTKEKCLGPVA
jgi:hypothetical protein